MISVIEKEKNEQPKRLVTLIILPPVPANPVPPLPAPFPLHRQINFPISFLEANF